MSLCPDIYPRFATNIKLMLLVNGLLIVYKLVVVYMNRNIRKVQMEMGTLFPYLMLCLLKEQYHITDTHKSNRHMLFNILV